jgi:hypothetical protein
MKTDLDFGSSIVRLIHLANKLQGLSAGCEDMNKIYMTVLEIREVSRTLKNLMEMEDDQ